MKKTALLLPLFACAMFGDTFELGTIAVKGGGLEVNTIEQSVDAATIAQQNSESIADALDNMSGLSVGTVGMRGESSMTMRGFNAQRIGVYIDGIPIYVPYDGNFDYARFLTADIAQIDVSKGYSSVIYGANTMGGVINIVSKKPTKALEGNIKGALVLDSEGGMSRYETSLNLGTRQDNFYVQLGGVYSDREHYRLSSEYESSESQPKGERLRSAAEDYKVSIKAGYVADDGSEIAAGWASQRGVKEQPPSTDPKYVRVRYWDWPLWDKDTFYFTGIKNFETSYVKFMTYYDTYTNSLFSYDDANYTSMDKKYAFKSRYEDYSYGARLEYGMELGDHLLSSALAYKKDVHNSYDLDKVTESKTLYEDYQDHVVSLGIEDTYSINARLQLLAGIGYDTQIGDKAKDTNTAYAELLTTDTRSAFSPEAALIYTIENAGKIRAGIARKTYMPSMKDRYSRRFNSYVPNSELKNELATHYELGYYASAEVLSYSLAGFYSVVDDAIQSVVYDAAEGLSQNQNVGTFEHTGGELDVTYRSDVIETGGNYTYTFVKNVDTPEVKRIDAPRHQLFVYADVLVARVFSIYGDMKWREGAYSQIADKSFELTPSFVTFDLKMSYKPVAALKVEAGVKNLTDRMVQYSLGFPVAGREYFANLNYTF